MVYVAQLLTRTFVSYVTSVNFNPPASVLNFTNLADFERTMSTSRGGVLVAINKDVLDDLAR